MIGKMNIQDRVRSKLACLERRKVSMPYTREAAVLMPIFERGGVPHFLLTKRTNEVETHKGQISFPGGMREADEDLEQTALRETFEEVGIERDKISVLGRFHDYLSITDYRVTPYAAYVSTPFITKPQTREVAEILEVPFSIFTDPSRLRIEQGSRRGEKVAVYFYSYGAHEIWGLTALIIRDFFEELNSSSQSDHRL
jgi:8-oxo-dGTP pyrophosphatase MutT (NUDIX family)